MKLNWSKVAFAYICMAIMGATSWLYCTWSFRDMWKGSLVGVAMLTVLLLSFEAEDFVHKLKSRYYRNKHKQKPPLDKC